ncbi:MAG: glycosyltransferase [Chloroflexota bacterium]|nr:glycosyltransferase [Dehalococcoidia bacterium]MDW8254703.1 glycosyltransferase [Chloroflexota bacterium]
MSRRPRLALVSTDVRRDLIDPLRFFRRVEIAHLARRSTYRDFEGDAGLRWYRSPADLVAQLAALRPDVVQPPEPVAARLLPASLAALAYCRLTATPLLAVTFENRPWEVKFGRLAPAVRAAAGLIFRAARVVVVLNEGARRNALAAGASPARLRRLLWGTWGVDLAEFSPGPAVDAPRLLFAGRLHEEKGITDLLDAFAEVRARLPAAQLTIAGDGPARGEAERRARAIGGVVLLGVVPNRKLPAVMRRSALVVSPSRTTPKWAEQVGMTNLQALACGVPVVTTWSGAIPEYTPPGAGAVLVPERDPAALAAAILRLLGDAPLRSQLGRLGRRLAEREYDAERNVRRAEALVLAVAG